MWLGCPIHSIRAMDGNRLVVHVTVYIEYCSQYQCDMNFKNESIDSTDSIDSEFDWELELKMERTEINRQTNRRNGSRTLTIFVILTTDIVMVMID